MLLEVRNLTVRYGGVTAVNGIDLDVGAGEAVALIGSNGAGKSSTLMALSGIAPAIGSIRFDGEEIGSLSPVERVRRGIVQVPEGRRIFPRLTVDENILMGGYVGGNKPITYREERKDAITRSEDTAPHPGLQTSLRRERYSDRFEEVLNLFPILKERLRQMGGTLSGGEQQMLAIARGLMAEPRLMLLDEPSLGLAPLLVQRIYETIERLVATGRSILLVEQNARAALRVSHRAYCLETGIITLSGRAVDLTGDRRVQEAYLGVAGA
ncbi:MAG: ABC transporter ATP-binding protein [Calditrichaeota bacterium]|nr:ABC transporter ATP-binding protein [Calditrichota bacterium]